MSGDEEWSEELGDAAVSGGVWESELDLDLHGVEFEGVELGRKADTVGFGRGVLVGSVELLKEGRGGSGGG